MGIYANDKTETNLQMQQIRIVYDRSDKTYETNSIKLI